MKKIFPLLAVMLLISICSLAQSRLIKGTLKDSTAKTPIVNAVVRIKGTDVMTASDKLGNWQLMIPKTATTIEIVASGYPRREMVIKENITAVAITLVRRPAKRVMAMEDSNRNMVKQRFAQVEMSVASAAPMTRYSAPSVNYGETEAYAPINENIFHAVKDQPLSTFSADVDRAAYSNVRRYLNGGDLPPADAVRVEEMINYFDYHYPQPKGKDPVAIVTDMSVCPWNSRHQLVRIGIQGKLVDNKDIPASNLVFLLDVSGSMEAPNKLPLVKKAFGALIKQLRPQDRVAIVVYAGAAGVVLPSTHGNQKEKITAALEQLEAGGSTAGGAGISLAYKIARENYLPKGNNRVILATDGDFNVGASSSGELQRLIEGEKDKGIFLSVLGFGMGNLKDVNLETLADKGNGNYAYIDNYEEARRIFVTEFGGTLFTIAKDVKLQVEFNPNFVQSYRLVGYENRLLQAEDFNNDKKDAGDMGAGHTVTALYEIVPAGGVKGQEVNWVDPLKYQEAKILGNRTEVLTVKMRYKEPDSNTSSLVQQVLHYQSKPFESMDTDFRLAASVAAFGQLLRESAFQGEASYEQVLKWAANTRENDPEGYRAEYQQLVKKAQLLQK
ncbi:Ca-activated chloride channel family protein [Chitinophaga jiangningensis]|uniref:Ca-activated chloride channel family protein n=1 Tax=Chitinophaga jiangningensis TaxID=1419482 RepID=A0A1M7HA34_9BACT|nr:von Willebrand factor type A domain-containing protein [Chitinophaga jiangningensis]SHM25296.1 Ca-activated chloride channel family protein [Chitinophaga jiangningensis]